MATQAQILANRHNAQKSTGPRTAEGKATVAKNATKHGLFAQDNVVISEKQAAFDALRDEMLKELNPVGAMESILAERIVSLTWRLKRAARMQDEVIDVKIRREINGPWPELSESLITGKPCDLSKDSEKCYDDQALGYIAMRDFAGDRALERLSMYERRFEASLFKTMAEFQKLRQARKAKEAEEIEKASPEKAPDPFFGERVEKQSQSSGGQEELSVFEKRDYELLLGATPTPEEANGLPRRTENRPYLIPRFDRGFGRPRAEGGKRPAEEDPRLPVLTMDKKKTGGPLGLTCLKEMF